MTVSEIRGQYPNSIIALCYGTAHVFNSLSTAKRFFKTSMLGCDGCEAERYALIVDKLADGWTVVSDNENILTEDCEFTSMVRNLQLHGRIKTR